MPDPFPPSDAVFAKLPTARRCWNCDYYSFKVYGGSEHDTQGKCFRDYKASHIVHWVDGNMVCPGYIPDRTVEE